MDKDHTRDDQVGLASVNAADVLTTGKITEGWYFYFNFNFYFPLLLPSSTSISTFHFPLPILLLFFFFKLGMI